MTVTITQADSNRWEAVANGHLIGTWVVPVNGGTPVGWTADSGDHPDYMEWVYAVNGGTPKAWVTDDANGVVYFLTGEADRIGYAYQAADGSPAWHDNAGISDMEYDMGDPEADAFIDAERAAYATLIEAEALAPALTTRG